MNYTLSNDTKIGFSNAFDAMDVHRSACRECYTYLVSGDGDLCEKGKTIIAENIAYSNTEPELNQPTQ